MKRSEHIVLLSRDHHFGLLCAWKIQQGLKKEVAPERIAAYIQFYWENNQQAHFQEEEQFLFPHLQNELVHQALEEHQQLREMITHLAAHPTDKEVMGYFAELLKNHIRYEERVLFPYMETHLNEITLQQIGKDLNHHHHTEVETYDDAFWE